MVTLCYDEAGEFEKKTDDKIGFIAGFVFDDLGEKDETLNEKNRINLFLKKACDNVGMSYPEDLHVSYGNNERVKKVKIEYSKYLEQFIKDGSYGGEELLPQKRKGKYSFIIELATKDKKSKYADNKSFVSDSIYSNLYDHMVSDYIEHALYTNPYANVEELSCDFPTRVFEAKEDLEFYTKVGYHSTTAMGGKVLIFDLREETLRTKTTEIISKNPEKSIKLKSFSGRSINEGYKASSEEDIISFAFLFLADVICSYFQKNIRIDSNAMNLEQSFRTRFDAECSIYIYSDLDEIYTNIYKNISLGKLSDNFVDLCLIKSMDTATADFYAKAKLEQVIKNINDKMTAEEYKNIYKVILSKTDQLDNNLKQAIKEILEKLNHSFREDISIEDKITIYDVELILNNDCELLFSKTYEAINENRFFDAYDYLFGIEQLLNSKDKTGFFYEMIESRINKKSFANLVERLDEETKVSRIKKSVNFIFDKALELKELLKISDYNSYNNCVFDLYDAGIAINNHAGDTKKCRGYFEKIDQIKSCSDEKYKKQLNRHIVHVIDCMDYDLAYDMSKKTILNFGNQNINNKAMTMGEAEDLDDHIKSISQLAQVCAFINEHNLISLKNGTIPREQYELMKKYPDTGFKSAIDKYMATDPANAKLSINYYLHYLADKALNMNVGTSSAEIEKSIAELEKKTWTKSIGRKIDKLKEALEALPKDNSSVNELDDIKNNYIKYSTIFYDGLTDAKAQMDYAFNCEDKEYRLFLLCKSMVAFCSDEEIKSVFTDEVIKKIDSMINKYHPFEITCYYLALIMRRINKPHKKKQYYEYLCKYVDENDGIIKIISLSLKYKYLQAENDKKAKAVKDELIKEISLFTDGRLPIDDEAEKIIGYSYN